MAQTHRSLYRFELWNPSEGMVGDLSDLCTSRKFTIKRNRAESLDLSFNLRLLDERADATGQTAQEILRPGINEIHVWRGNRPLFGTKVRYMNPGVQEDSETMDLRATGYLDDFSKRHLRPVPGVEGGKTMYTAIDIGQIIWDMVTTTQGYPNGDMGFTQGTIQTSRPLTDEWHPYANSLKDIFINLSNRDNSVDFDFSHDRKFNIYYPAQGRVQSDLLFTYPGNIASLSAPIDADQVVNYSINRGGGNGPDVTPIQTRQDAASQLEYGLLEQIDDYSDISVVATLNSLGDETLRTFNQPLVIPEVLLRSGREPDLGAYWVGDWVRFAVPNRPSFGHVDDALWRINEISVTLNDLDREEVRLTVASA